MMTDCYLWGVTYPFQFQTQAFNLECAFYITNHELELSVNWVKARLLVLKSLYSNLKPL